MNTKLIYYLAMVVLGGVGILIMLNLSALLFPSVEANFIPEDEVRGMAIQHKDKLYTLNFAQQNAVVDILNRAIHLASPPSEDVGVKAGFEKMIIYRFNGESDIEIKPISFVDDNLQFYVPQWEFHGQVHGGYLREVSAGALHQLLSQTYDP